MAMPKFKTFEAEVTFETTIKVEIDEADIEKRDLADLIFEQVQDEIDPFSKGDCLTVDAFKAV